MNQAIAVAGRHGERTLPSVARRLRRRPCAQAGRPGLSRGNARRPRAALTTGRSNASRRSVP